MTNALTTRTCPECGSQLQRLSGKDGHKVVNVMSFDKETGIMSGRVELKALMMDAIYACQTCEHVEGGR